MQTFHRSILILLVALSAMLSSCGIIPGGDIDQDEALQKLSGVWFRVKSNNPSNDGLQLTVIGDAGTITANPRGGFNVGDVKWRDLTGTSNNSYAYSELGSDGSYYDATMELDGDTVRISIASSGAGNIQKWVKEAAYTEPAAQTITLDCSGFSTATNLVNSEAEVDYIVPSGCVVDVTAALTIDAGTVIQFEENAGMGVYDNGSIKAIGTAATPIVLQGTASSKGYWRGIHIETNTIENQFDFVEISDAGSNYVYCCNTVASVFLKGGKISIKNTDIKNGAGIGLYANQGADLREFESVNITTHDEYPMSLHLERVAQLDGTSSTFSGNGKDYIFIQRSTLGQNTEISETSVPYLFDGEVFNVTSRLTINEGAELVFEENAGLGVYDNGILDIAGTASNKVIIRGKEAIKGYWRGIHSETSSSSNKINHAVISDAGSEYVFCCNTKASIFLKDGSMAITNTEIKNGDSYGIVTKSDFEFTDFASNTITTHKLNPVYISGKQAGSLDGLGTDYSGNDRDFLLLYRDQINEATTLRETNVPFRVDNNVVLDVVEAFTLEAGVDMVFSENAGIGVYDNGSLNAVGTASKGINFRGAEAQSGYWRGIHVETNSSSNVFDYVELNNAASTYVYCCNEAAGLFMKSGSMTVKNSSFSDNDGCAIKVNPNATLTESSNTFSNNTGGEVCN